MIKAKSHPVRILQVLGGLNPGGIETWLLHLLHLINREEYHMDFMVHTHEVGAYDQEVEALGSSILRCPHTSRPWIYAHNFRHLLSKHGPYDVVHSHVDHYNGYVLRLAYQAGVPIRIAHSHCDTFQQQAQASAARQLYLILSKRWIDKYATVGLAASRQAATSLFGPQWEKSNSRRVLYLGIDLRPFCYHDASTHVRASLGIPDDVFVIGHVGRFHEQKNHTFLLDIAHEIAKREHNFRVLLVGDGALRPTIAQKAAELGLSEHVIYTGLRRDISLLMQGAMDVFVLPSLFEGLPLVLIEAQAAGLPCFVSSFITREADIVEGLIQRFPLSYPPALWANAILETRSNRPQVVPSDAYEFIKKSSFNILTGLESLKRYYCA